MGLYTLNTVVNQPYPELQWIFSFKEDKIFNTYRFKYFSWDNGPLRFDFISEWIDVIQDIDELFAFEKDRIPLFFVDDFLLPAELFEKGAKLRNPIIALLKKPLLKDKVLGLAFYSVNLKKNNVLAYLNRHELIFFNNDYKKWHSIPLEVDESEHV